jgi:hypothetical protein
VTEGVDERPFEDGPDRTACRVEKQRETRQERKKERWRAGSLKRNRWNDIILASGKKRRI